MHMSVHRPYAITFAVILAVALSLALPVSRSLAAPQNTGTFASSVDKLACPTAAPAARTVAVTVAVDLGANLANTGQVWFTVSPASAVENVSIASSPFGTQFENAYNTTTGLYRYTGTQLGGNVGSSFNLVFNVVVAAGAVAPSNIPLTFVTATAGSPDGTQFFTPSFQQVLVTGNNLTIGVWCDGVTPGDPSTLPGYPLAWHTGSGPTVLLGSTLNTDGVVRTPGFVWTAGTVAGGLGGSVDITTSNGPGFVSAWIDWNNDRDFDDPGEQILTNREVVNGPNPGIRFDIPTSPPPSLAATFNARFRVYPTIQTSAPLAPPAPSGGATGGETEDYSWPFGPNAVTLAAFEAEAQGDDVRVTWETATEWNTAGFFVYRSSSPDTVGVLVNAQMIAAQGTQGQGAFYQVVDAGLAPGAYFYTLEDVDASGVRTQHGPVSAVVGDPSAVALGRAATGSAPSILLLVLLVGSLAVATGVTAARRRS